MTACRGVPMTKPEAGLPQKTGNVGCEASHHLLLKATRDKGVHKWWSLLKKTVIGVLLYSAGGVEILDCRFDIVD